MLYTSPPPGNPPIILPKHQPSQAMPDKQPKQTQHSLHSRQLQGKLVLSQWAPPHKPQIDQGEVRRLDKSPFLIQRHSQQFQSIQHLKAPSDWSFRLPIGRPRCNAWFQEPRPRVKPWKSMARTRHKPKQLWDGIYKVEDLRDKQQDESLAEVAQYADHDENHTREVAVSVAYKHAGGVPIIPKKCE